MHSHSDDLNALANFSTNYVNKPNEIYELLDVERPGDDKTLNKSDSLIEKIQNPLQKQISLNLTPKNSQKLEKVPTSTFQPKLSNSSLIESKTPEEKANNMEGIGFKSFQILKILGAGSFGKVYLVRKKNDEKVFAMKALKKRDLIIKKQLRYAVTEVNVLKRCNHPFILTLHYAFQVILYKEK